MEKNSSDGLKIGTGIASCLLAGGLSAYFVHLGLQPWYQHLKQPPWLTANFVFGPLWLALYLLMGVAFGLVLARGNERERKTAKICFGIQLAFAVLWNASFFGFRSPAWGYLFILLLWFSLLATLWTASKVRTVTALLLLPFFLWVTYTSTLNYWILRANVVDPRVAEMKNDPRNAEYFDKSKQPKDRSIFAEPERDIN
jgi:tryptophan-rich sensory protein